MIKTVPLKKYCEMSGESIDAVNKRIDRGVWPKGIIALKIPGIKERWIDLEAVEQWARNSGKISHVA